jgi:hypothetical protein
MAWARAAELMDALLPITVTGRMRARNALPATPRPLFPTAAAMPAQEVPCMSLVVAGRLLLVSRLKS